MLNFWNDRSDNAAGTALSSLGENARKADQQVIEAAVADGRKIYYDVSMSFAFTGSPVGVVRAETCYAHDLASMGVGTPVVWHENQRRFIVVPRQTWLAGETGQFLDGIASDNHVCDMEAGSLLLVFGLNWWHKPAYLDDLLWEVEARRLSLVPFVHDVIWDKLVRFFAPGSLRRVVTAARKLIQSSSALLTNSRCSLADIKAFCAKYGLPDLEIRDCPQCDYAIMKRPSVSARFAALSCGRGFVLNVSPFYRYKNQDLLLWLWRDLIQAHGPENVPLLAIVGSEKSLKREFLTRAFRDRIIRKHIRLLRNVDDESLAWLYQNCLFTVFPSLYEGWGLPVGESLAYGKICIASNAASMPEVAPDHTDLIDPRDYPAWYERLERYIFSPEARRAREKVVAGFRPPTSMDGTTRMLANALAMYPGAAREPALEQGRRICNFSAYASGRYLGDGWEINGLTAHAKGEKAALRFSLGRDSGPVVLELECVASSYPLNLAIAVNGALVQVSSLEHAGHEISLPLPARAVAEGEVRVEFSVSRRKSAPLGLTLVSFSLEQAPDEPAQVQDCLEIIGKLCPPLIPPLRGVLQRRPDLVALLDGEEGCLRLFFWIWRYGIGEEPTLGAHWRDVERTLRNLAATQSKQAIIPGYSCLLDALWAIRPDLRGMDKSTAAGQKALVGWLIAHGKTEYNFHEIVA